MAQEAKLKGGNVDPYSYAPGIVIIYFHFENVKYFFLRTLEFQVQFVPDPERRRELRPVHHQHSGVLLREDRSKLDSHART